MEAIKKVTRIDRTVVAKASSHQPKSELRRVAAYARVSTDSDEQFTSFEAQVDYYTRQIAANPDWTMVEVYTDADTSYGPNTKLSEYRKNLKLSPYVLMKKCAFRRNLVN